MDITIVIPMYNAEKTIKRCLHNIVKSPAFNRVEILIIDDGSSDNSAKIIRDSYSKFNNVKLLQFDNQGVSCARNRGLEAAHTEWVFFLDAVDAVSEDAVDCIVEKAS